MQKMKMMTPGDIERLAKANARKARDAHYTTQTQMSVFGNRVAPSHEPPCQDRGFNPVAAQRSSDRMLHHAVEALNCDPARTALRMGANVHSIVDSLALKNRIYDLKRKVPPRVNILFADNTDHDQQMEKINDIVELLNAHGAGIPEETPRQVERPVKKPENAEMYLHAAVETLDFTWAEKMLKQRADVKSVIGGLTLKQRVEQLRNGNGRIPELRIERMAALLRAHGADV